MKSFSLGALSQWRQVAPGEVLDFPVPETAGHRSVELEVIASSFVTVHAATKEDAYLLGCGDGQLSIRFKAHESLGVVIEGEPDALVYIQTWADAPIIPESLDETLTVIEPRQVGPSDDMRRIMRLVQLNEQRRDELMQEQLAAYRAEMEAAQATQQQAQVSAQADNQAPSKDEGDGAAE